MTTAERLAYTRKSGAWGTRKTQVHKPNLGHPAYATKKFKRTHYPPFIPIWAHSALLLPL